jgi:hypothetical protein
MTKSTWETSGSSFCCWSPSRKDIVRVVLSKQQREILRQIIDKHALKRCKNSVAESSKYGSSEGATSFLWLVLAT